MQHTGLRALPCGTLCGKLCHGPHVTRSLARGGPHTLLRSPPPPPSGPLRPLSPALALGFSPPCSPSPCNLSARTPLPSSSAPRPAPQTPFPIKSLVAPFPLHLRRHSPSLPASLPFPLPQLSPSSSRPIPSSLFSQGPPPSTPRTRRHTHAQT